MKSVSAASSARAAAQSYSSGGGGFSSGGGGGGGLSFFLIISAIPKTLFKYINKTEIKSRTHKVSIIFHLSEL